MSIINAYGDSTITVWELDDNGQKISVPIQNESKQVIGNKIILEGLPDEQYRVFIDGFVEIDIKENITEPNQFKVAYRNGTGSLFVHESLDGQWITVSRYYSRGMYYIPSSRIWTKLGSDGEVIETLKDFEVKVQGAVDIAEDIRGTINLADQTKQNLDESVVIGNQTINNLDDLVAQTDFATINNKISALQNIRIHEGTTEPTDTKFWYDPSDD